MNKKTLRLKIWRASTFENSWDFANYKEKASKMSTIGVMNDQTVNLTETLQPISNEVMTLLQDLPEGSSVKQKNKSRNPLSLLNWLTTPFIKFEVDRFWDLPVLLNFDCCQIAHRYQNISVWSNQNLKPSILEILRQDTHIEKGTYKNAVFTAWNQA